MSKKPLINESVARRWAKYAGIENHSKSLLSEMYDEEMKEGDMMNEEEEEGEEEDDMLAELESMLSEQEEEEVETEEELEEPEEELEEPEEEPEEELEVEDEPGMEGSMSQTDVEAAVKAGLEAMAQAIGDSLKIKIDVRSGEEIEEPEGLEEPAGEMEMAPEMGEEELMERVLKRVAARLVKESKKRK